MRLNRFHAAILAALAFGGCTKPVSDVSDEPTWLTVVVGPDLEAQGPFGNHPVTLTAAEAPSPMRIDIRPGGTEEATLTHVVSDTKTYLAGVTWHVFTPIVAETNAARMDYWIVGLNLTRTPDRSIYSVMRFPHGADLTAPGAKVEYALLSCGDLALARQAAFVTGAKSAVALGSAPAPEAGDCEFDSLKEAYMVTEKILNAYDRVRHEKDAPALDWHTLKVALD